MHDPSFGDATPAAEKRAQSRGPNGSSNETRDKNVPTGNDSSDSDDDATQRPTHRDNADPALTALLREASESSSSSSEDEAYAQRDHEGSSKPTKKKRQKNRYELPVSNLAVLVLACWTMRLPIIYMDIIR